MKDQNNFSRRNFFKSAGMGAAAVAGLPLLAQSCSPVSETAKIHDFFAEGDVILFQGDSITDAGRNKRQELPNNAWSFGMGYANYIGSWLLEEMPEKDLTIYNRGISGNKVYQLADRWEKDCLDLKPNVLSILIGVNDYWHFRNGEYDGTPAIYENDLRKLLSRTLEALPDLKLMICQPFILTGTSAVDETWVEPFSAYQASAKKISDEFGAIWVPFQEAFDSAIELAEPTYWAADGVHPSMAGAQLMAKTWLEALNKASS
ncbi:MAG: SGNH/GDSL hydrolase family protein [Bacteroidetes bacterium]|nr:SGNH/GDSL hydrolase family protein [Bacteroidota bacterium]